jgi:hypothetical protein
VGVQRQSTPKHPPNQRLTWERLQRGWSREELTEQIRRSMKQAGEPVPGLNADIIRRWESGDRKPEPRYKKHLVLVFGKTAQELGLLSVEELQMRPVHESPISAEGHRVLHQEKIIDAVAKRVMLAMFGDGIELNRSAFLKGVLATSLVASLPSGLTSAEAPGVVASDRQLSLDVSSVQAFSTITTSHRDLYWASPPADLLTSVVAHVRMGYTMLKSASNVESPLAKRHALSLAESALLAARIVFFDLGGGVAAEKFFDLAESAASLSKDHLMMTGVLAHRAFVPGFAGQEQEARAYLNAAHAHIRYASGPGLRSWLHCVDAEISARTGQPKVSLARIASADEAILSSGEDPLWLDFFDSSRLDAFAGNALYLAGRQQQAADRLNAALERINGKSAKQRPVILLDLAAAQASTDAEQALATAHLAFDAIDASPYAVALDRVPDVKAALRSTPHASELDERARSLTAEANWTD